MMRLFKLRFQNNQADKSAVGALKLSEAQHRALELALANQSSHFKENEKHITVYQDELVNNREDYSHGLINHNDQMDKFFVSN